ncbi:FRG domain-containing protein [Lacisediminimonas sp.]|uniref:FRG domain-containing protein n=1 Tax=Lacisediminimonas sp. TaxID=3060582 RepID=UPI002724DF35|nr:FRG domain-containing protein [Lacisediminimonas sp.]MDO8300919.1 FRG domain-containing protein [Lacisediminimonas sp.]
MKTIQITSWEEFVALSANLDGWAFRGHQDERWPLISSLTRYLYDFIPNHLGWRAREERAIRIFRRKAHNYLPDANVLEEDLRCLALMQHHGAPTRLLDFTKSPFVAAFFALEKATSNAAVFALNTPVLYNATPIGRPELTRDEIDPRVKGNFERHFIDNHEQVIWIGEPTQMDRRLVAQSGTFVLPGMIDKSLDQILSQYGTNETLISKIVLPQAMRDEAMRALYRMNITNATLFPDLEGLARSVAFELEIIWPGLIDDPSYSMRAGPDPASI